MLGYGAQTIPDIFPIQPEFLAAGLESSERDVDVWVLCVEVRHCHPFERRVKIGLGAAHYVPSQPLQVEPLAELRGDDQLPQPWVAALLPFLKFGRDIYAGRFRGEACLFGLE
jgi:hypothetical protein